MRFVTLTSFAACSCLAFAQETPGAMPGPPPEMKKLAFFLGEWTGKVTLYIPGMEPAMSDSTVVEQSVFNGMYHKTTYTADIPGMGKLEGVAYTTYDPAAKAYRGWSFDNMSATPQEDTGQFDGTKMVMVSKPINRGAGPVVYRSTSTRKSDREFHFLIEMKTGEEFIKLVEGTYKKKA